MWIIGTGCFFARFDSVNQPALALPCASHVRATHSLWIRQGLLYGTLTLTTVGSYPILFDASGQQPALVVFPNGKVTGTIVVPESN